ncbi:hypothetical protein INR49_020876 [Caranx melampygus]|nr:hypothetical protein INR49_020876 [Caranx melampygus]
MEPDADGNATTGVLSCIVGNGAQNGQDSKPHEGVDIVCQDGSDVYAPFDVTLNGRLLVYNRPEKAAMTVASTSAERVGLYGLCFKLFYVRPDRTSGTVRKGQKIGTMLPMQSVYPGITSHIHIQMCDKSDPSHTSDWLTDDFWNT